LNWATGVNKWVTIIGQLETIKATKRPFFKFIIGAPGINKARMGLFWIIGGYYGCEKAAFLNWATGVNK
jgi:hypothetical protein